MGVAGDASFWTPSTCPVKYTVKGIPYISTKSEMKKAETTPHSFQFIFRRKKRGMRNELKRSILTITKCHLF
jgi:hypothetical protein